MLDISSDNIKTSPLLDIINAHALILQTDERGVIKYVSDGFCSLTGYDRSELLQKECSLFSSGLHKEYFYAKMWKELQNAIVWKGEIQNLNRDGSNYWLNMKIIPLTDSFKKIEGYVSISHDVTDKVKREDEIQEKNRELQKLASFDYLTNLYSRVKIDELLRYELNKFQRYGKKFGAIMIDIDFFKTVNDDYGHQMGDQILVEFAQELLRNSRLSDSVGRWGGEEFLVISPNVDVKGLMAQAEEIRRVMDQYRFSVVGRKTVSIGISLIRENDEIRKLIKRADEALYDAKKGGRNRVCVR